MIRVKEQANVGEQSRGEGVVMTVPDDNEVIEAIIHASRAMVGIAIRSLTDSGEAVTLPQYRTLVVLSDAGPRRLADLADALGVSPSTATRMCDRLVRKGLITRTRDGLDRREVNLAVTPAGRATVVDVINRRRSDVCALLRSIPLGTRRELVDSLRLLSEATGDVPDPPLDARLARITGRQAIRTLLASQNSRIPRAASSRP